MVRGMILYSGAWLERDSDFFHFSLGQHVQHDLCAELESITEGLTVCQHIDLPLGIHSGFNCSLFQYSINQQEFLYTLGWMSGKGSSRASTANASSMRVIG